MTIAKELVVSVDYELKDDEGNVLERSENEPLTYVHGVDHLISGFVEALEGRASGEELTFIVPPEKGYGRRDDGMVFRVKRSELEVPEELKAGMEVEADDGHRTRSLTVLSVEGDEVVLDANHPLADRNLHFSVKIRNVRPMTAEEKAHAHDHGECSSCSGCGH